MGNHAQQRQQAHAALVRPVGLESAPVPARLGALDDQPVGAGGLGRARLREVGDGEPHRDVDCVQAVDVARARASEGE